MKTEKTTSQLDTILAQAAVSKLIQLQMLPTNRVMNIGGGYGDFAVKLSEHCSLVEIVDHDSQHLHDAADNAALHGSNNIAYVHSDWQKTPLKPADMIFVGPLLSLRAADLPFLYSITKKALVLITAIGGTPHAYHGIHPELADSYKKHLEKVGLDWNSEIIPTDEAEYEMIWVWKHEPTTATDE